MSYKVHIDNLISKERKGSRNANILLFVGLLVMILAPSILILNTPIWLENFFGSLGLSASFDKTGEIGDTIGGITSPFVNTIGALLVYWSFKSQIRANESQWIALAEEIDGNERKRTMDLILRDISDLREDINSFSLFGEHKESGLTALHEFTSNSWLPVHLDEIVASPAFQQFYSIVSTIDMIRESIESDMSMSVSNKVYLSLKLSLLYRSKMRLFALRFLNGVSANLTEEENLPKLFIDIRKIILGLDEHYR